MKINHTNLTVTDVRAAREFLQTYFDFQQLGDDAGLAVLRDEDDFVLTVMEAGEEDSVNYPSTFHIGFFVEREETVDELHRRLTEGGFDVPVPSRSHHSYNFYVEAPGGFTVEVGA